MALSLHPRSKVRLRLERATALLRQPGATSLLCALVDLSEEGCHCLLSLDDVDSETALSWRGVLAKGLVVSLEISDPPELRGLLFHEAEVRWVQLLRNGDMEFGLHLSNPKPEQKQILGRALLAFAAAKLRHLATAASGKPAANETAPVEKPRPATRAQPKPAPPQAARLRTRPIFIDEPQEMRLSGVARQRPHRLKVSLPVVFEFCGPDGRELEQGLHQGSTVDVSEGGIMLEGPAPDFCQPTQLVGYKACASVTICAGDHDVKGFCSVRTAVPSHHKENHWLYGLQIVDMSATDREILHRTFAQTKAEKSGKDEA